VRRLAGVVIVLAAAVAAFAGGRAGTGVTAPAPWPDELTAAAAHPAATAPVGGRGSTSWCGTTSTSDRPPAVTGYPVRVFYAIPADGADQSAMYAPQISDMIDQIDSWWQREDPSRVPRFDVYAAPCGLQVDLQVIRLPSVSVSMTDAHQIFSLVWTQMQSQPDAGTAKYLLFVDDVDTGDTCGVGGTAAGATLGSPAMGMAIVLLNACNGSDRASTAAHELLHAVSPAGGFPNSPHTCPGDINHFCDSSGDILYPYAESGIPLTSLQLDYGHDDYWAGTAPTNLQVQPWFRHTQDQVHLGLTIAGKGAIQLSAASADGYRFVRWTGDGCTGDADCSLTLDASKEVSALFAPDAYPLAVKVTGGGIVTSTPSGIVCRRGTCTKPFPSYQAVLLTAKPAKGSHFTGWSGSCHGKKTKCSVPMTAASAVRAAFAKTH
jgi:hypothetical protein